MLPTKHKVSKFALYGALGYLFVILQSTPGFFVLFGVRPALTAALAVSVALLEGGFAGGIFGACVGLLCDCFSYNSFGFNGLTYFLCCVLVGLLMETYMRPVLLNCVLFSFGTVFAIESVSFFFRYFLPRTPDALFLYVWGIIPAALYTAAAAIPIYLLTRRIFNNYKKKVVA